MYGITNITEIIPFAVLISPQLSWKSPQQTRHLQIFLIPRLSLYKLLSQSFQTAPQSFSESLFYGLHGQKQEQNHHAHIVDQVSYIKIAVHEIIISLKQGQPLQKW